MRDRLVANWSIEATPAQWGALSSDAGQPAGGRVYVPALPKSSGVDVAAACAAIRACDHEPVPHGRARSIEFFGALRHHAAPMQRTAATGS